MLGFSKPGWYSRQLDEKIILLEQGDFRQIPWIFCSLTENHNPSKLKAANALTRSIQNMTFDQIIKTDSQVRQTTSMEWSINWHNINPESLFSPKMNASQRRAIIIFASFHPNGYLREKAVKMMGQYRFTLAFMILRQNDWVSQVRTAATLAVQARMNCLSANELLYALPFAEKIKGCKHSHSAKFFFDFLTNPDNQPELIQGLNSTEIRTRRLCILALLNSDHSVRNVAVRQLRQEPDPFLRKLLFKHLIALKENMDEYANIFLRDKYPPNRILALTYFKTKYTTGQSLRCIATDCLTDKNAGVRNLARTIITELEPCFDFVSFYRSHLEQHTASAILGLGETGQADNCSVIEGYLHSDIPNITSAAIASLMKLDSEQYSSAALYLLDNPHAGIVKTVQRLITKYHCEDYEKIKFQYENTSYRHSKIKCASILFSAPKWQRIIYILQVLSSQDEELQNMALNAVFKWHSSFNNFYGSPTLQQTEIIKQLIFANDRLLPSQLKKELLFVLR